MCFVLWGGRGVQEHVTSRWFVPGCTSCSNETLCCVRGSWNWQWSNYFSCKLSVRFPVTLQVTETTVASSLVHISQEMLYRTNLSHCIWAGGMKEVLLPSLTSIPTTSSYPSTIFPTYIFLASAPPRPSDITWLFSNDVTWGRRRFAIWRPGWLRRLRWQCVGSWRRDGRGLYWRRQRCGCQWGAGWHDALQPEGGYCTRLSWIMLHACATKPARTVPQFWTTVTLEKGTPYPYGWLYVVMLHGIP